MAEEVTRAAGPPHDSFAVDVDVDAGRVTLHGEIDVLTAPLFSDLAGVIMAHGPAQVTVCFADVAFIDAAGLGALVRLRNTLADAGQRLVVTDTPARLARTFAFAGLSELLAEGRQQVS